MFLFSIYKGGQNVMTDILFKTEDYIFSYRVAGILIHNGKILLQRPINDSGYSFPGGHVSFGETNEQTLIREFLEEINADISVNGLRWVGENFFPWGDKPCHQICLFFDVSLKDEAKIPLDHSFFAIDEWGNEQAKLEFSWISLDQIADIELYPLDTKELLQAYSSEIKHFVYKQQ